MGRTDNIDSSGCHNASLDCTVEVFAPRGGFLPTLSEKQKSWFIIAGAWIRLWILLRGNGFACWNFQRQILSLKGGRFATQCAIFGPFHFLFYQICQLFRLTCSPIDWASKIPRRPGSSNWNKIQNIQTIQSKIHSELTTMVFRNNGKWSLSSADRQSNNREGEVDFVARWLCPCWSDWVQI